MSLRLVIKITRLSFGGFMLALKFSHTMSDASGMIQFLMAITDFARASEIYDDRDLSFIVEQVNKAKVSTMEEHKRSPIALGILRALNRPTEKQAYVISDASGLGFLNLDFGRWIPVYAGPADNSIVPHLIACVYYVV